MFFVWGSGTKTVEAARDVGLKYCTVCGNEQSFRSTLTYTYRHFWYLIRFVTSRRYFCLCNRCNNGDEVRREAIADKVTSDPVPVMDRRGWLIGAGAVVAVVGLGAFVSQQNDAKTRAMLASPVVGDVYSAELSAISDGFSRKPSYGLMKLVAIEDGKEVFEIGSIGYNKKKGASQDFRSGKYANPGYFDSEDRVTYTLAELTSLYDKGTVFDIDRPANGP